MQLNIFLLLNIVIRQSLSEPFSSTLILYLLQVSSSIRRHFIITADKIIFLGIFLVLIFNGFWILLNLTIFLIKNIRFYLVLKSILEGVFECRILIEVCIRVSKVI